MSHEDDLKYFIMLTQMDERSIPQIIRSNVYFGVIEHAFIDGCKKLAYPVFDERFKGDMDFNLVHEIIQKGCPKELIPETVREYNKSKKMLGAKYMKDLDKQIKDLTIGPSESAESTDSPEEEIAHMYMFIASLSNDKIKYEIIPYSGILMEI